MKVSINTNVEFVFMSGGLTMAECDNVEIEVIRQVPPEENTEIRCSLIHESIIPIIQDVKNNQEESELKSCLEDKVLCDEVPGKYTVLSCFVNNCH